MMPLDLIFVRHGESQGNAAMAAARRGDESHFTEKYVTTPGRLWRLTPSGVEQARCAGAWLQSEIDAGAFHGHARFYVSPLVRTRETAGHLGLREARWRLNRSIRERDWGEIETVTKEEFRNTYRLSAIREHTDPLYWRPPGGEAIADVADLRVKNFFDTLHRERPESTVVAVSHGEYMRAVHLVLTRSNDETYSQWEEERSMSLKNCEIIHYTRVVPEELHSEEWPAGAVRSHLAYFRRARPVEDGAGWRQEVDPWEPITFHTYSNADLLEAVERGQQKVNRC